LVCGNDEKELLTWTPAEKLLLLPPTENLDEDEEELFRCAVGKDLSEECLAEEGILEGSSCRDECELVSGGSQLVLLCDSQRFPKIPKAADEMTYLNWQEVNGRR
jgi:hypothetical protein